MKRLIAAIICSMIPAAVCAVPPTLPQPKPLEFKPPKAQRFVLSNGIIVHFLEDHSLPQIQISGDIKGGSLYDPANKIGLSDIFGAVLPNGGTKELDPDALTKELELMGSSVGAGSSEESYSVSLFSLTRNFERTLDFFSQIILTPRLDQKKLDIEKKSAIGEIARRNDEPRGIAGREFRRMLYGPESPWGRRVEVKTIENISRKDLLDLHQRFFKPEGIILAVSGDIKQEYLKNALEKAIGSSKWSGKAQLPAAVEPTQPKFERRVYLVDKPSAKQCAVRAGHFGVKRHNPDHFALEVMNEILGGGFSSRLFRNVRSRKGLAYNVGSGYTEPFDYGMVLASVGTKNETTVQAVKEVLAQIQSMKDAPPETEELNTAKGQLIDSFVQNFSNSHQIASQYASMEFRGFPSDWLDTYQEKLRAVSSEQVLRAAVTYWKPEQTLIMVVGDSKSFDENVSVFGPVFSLDPESGEVKK